ncbi:hypothetical protein BDB01DRAFT_844402 [Pilobolus umbonatus]|nr:hypothetical protein BDB01DRAFT_844402 [Pilobolus umbonatus]
MSVTSPAYSPPIQATVTQPGLYEYLAELVSKRVATIKYIRKAHEGNTHWFNTILLTRENLTSLYENTKMAKRKTRTKEDTHFIEPTGEYTHLMLPHIPFEMDYLETFFTLVDTIAEAYYKVVSDKEEGSVCTHAYFELVLKCDGKFKKIVNMVTKELDSLARNAIKEELKLIDPLLLD